MNRKVDTMDLKGKEYARVPARIKLFREDTVNGEIQTSPTFNEDNMVYFKATVVKDRSNPESAMATGHSYGENTGNKAFEKLETIAIGRALANLGYLASGEVASFEEMEDYQEHLEEEKTAAVLEAVMKIEDTTSIEELKQVFMHDIGYIADPRVIEAKDRRKKELNESSKVKAK